MKILLTGGAGFIGSILTIEALNRNHHITIVDNLLYDQGNTQQHLIMRRNCDYIIANILDIDRYKSALQSADVVCHLAAIVGQPACDSYPELATKVNVNGTRLILKNLSKNQRLIFPNTNSGYGTVKDKVCSEETPLNPVSHYGRTKLEAEKIVLEHPLSSVFRLATVFGYSPRMRLDLLVNKFAHDAFFSGKIRVFGGSMRRNFIHVLDVADAFLWCVDKSDTYNQVFNLGNDNLNMTKLELANTITGHIGADVIEISGDDPDSRDYIVSSEKIKLFGYKEDRILWRGLEYGLKELISWFMLLPREERLHRQLVSRMNTTCSHRTIT